MQLSTCLHWPSPHPKKKKKKEVTTEYINLQPAGILSDRSQPHNAENYPRTHHCVTWTNPQHGFFPNTARTRLITDYQSTTGQAVTELRAATPKFWHQFPSQESPALGQVPALPTTPEASVVWTRISNSQCEKHLSWQLLTQQLQPSQHLKHLILELCWSRVYT